MQNPQEYSLEVQHDSNNHEGFTLHQLDQIRWLLRRKRGIDQRLPIRIIRLNALHSIHDLLHDLSDISYIGRYVGEIIMSQRFCLKGIGDPHFNVFHYLAINPRISDLLILRFEHILMGFDADFYCENGSRDEDSTTIQRMQLVFANNESCPMHLATENDNVGFIALIIKMLATQWFSLSILPASLQTFFKIKAYDEEIQIQDHITKAIVSFIDKGLEISKIQTALSQSQEIFPGGFRRNLLENVVPKASNMRSGGRAVSISPKPNSA